MSMMTPQIKFVDSTKTQKPNILRMKLFFFLEIENSFAIQFGLYDKKHFSCEGTL